MSQPLLHLGRNVVSSRVIRDLEATETFRARKAIFSSSSKNGEVYKCNRTRKVSGAFEKQAPCNIACENSRPSSLPAEWRFARRTSAIHRQKFHTDDVNVNFIILNKL